MLKIVVRDEIERIGLTKILLPKGLFHVILLSSQTTLARSILKFRTLVRYGRWLVAGQTI